MEECLICESLFPRISPNVFPPVVSAQNPSESDALVRAAPIIVSGIAAQAAKSSVLFPPCSNTFPFLNRLSTEWAYFFVPEFQQVITF